MSRNQAEHEPEGERGQEEEDKRDERRSPGHGAGAAAEIPVFFVLVIRNEDRARGGQPAKHAAEHGGEFDAHTPGPAPRQSFTMSVMPSEGSAPGSQEV